MFRINIEIEFGTKVFSQWLEFPTNFELVAFHCLSIKFARSWNFLRSDRDINRFFK